MNYIMISGHNEKHLSKIDKIDGVIMLNLEDGVPKDKKRIALKNIIEILEKGVQKEIVVRINSLEETGLNEIIELNRFNIPIRIPKVKNINDLDRVFDLTDNEIHLSIETKESFFNLRSFKNQQITKFYLGILDLFDDLKLSHNLITLNSALVEKILVDFVLNSLYLDKEPIGFVYQEYKNLETFREWCNIQKNLGLKGVGTITPKQLEIANQVFSIDNEEIELAKMIVEKFEKDGSFTFNGLYIDEPIYKNYLMKLKG